MFLCSSTLCLLLNGLSTSDGDVAAAEQLVIIRCGTSCEPCNHEPAAAVLDILFRNSQHLSHGRYIGGLTQPASVRLASIIGQTTPRSSSPQGVCGLYQTASSAGLEPVMLPTCPAAAAAIRCAAGGGAELYAAVPCHGPSKQQVTEGSTHCSGHAWSAQRCD